MSFLGLAEVETQSGPWERLWPLLLTAALTLVITMIVQFWVVPRVESQKRRDDRWERDLLALGELLTFELSTSATRAVSEAKWQLTLLAKGGPGSDWQGADEMKQKQYRKLSAARSEFRNYQGRLRWLVKRVDRWFPGLQPFRRAYLQFMTADLEVDNLVFKASVAEHLGDFGYAEEPPTPDQLEDALERYLTSVRALVVQVEVLLDRGRPPRQTPRGWVKKVLRTAKQRIRRKRDGHPR